jgi:NADH-quinone oxidoreductase subunit C
MDETALDDLREAIALRQEAAVVDSAIAVGELTMTVAPNTIASFLGYLRTDPSCRFTTLIDITAVGGRAR